MAKYECTTCNYVYDENVGIPNSGIPAGTKWSDLPADWACPVCGSPKSMFRLVMEKDQPVMAAKSAVIPATKKAVMPFQEDGVAVPAGYGTDDLRKLTNAEVAALCSSLAKGCEKQYLTDEQALFLKLSAYYQSKVVPISEATHAKLLELINKSLAEDFSDAKLAAESEKDCGALRVLTWSSKVTEILQGLIQRYEDKGAALFEHTNVYVCDICGFIYIGDEPPAICPVCKVPSLKLIKVERK